MVEYSSPNTNKPLHLGHIRNNLLGHAVSELLAAAGNKEVKVNLVRPITKDTGLVRATGRLIHRGRSTGTSEGDVRDAAGNLLAHGTTTCMIFPAKK